MIILIQKAKAPKEFIVVCYVTQPVLFILRERLMVRGRCGPLAGRLLGKGWGVGKGRGLVRVGVGGGWELVRVVFGKRSGGGWLLGSCEL